MPMSFDIGDSINGVLKERLKSPFWGTLICAWLVWNWEMWYVTFFIKEKYLAPMNKIAYIQWHCGDWLNLFLYPFLSALIILTLLPFGLRYLNRLHLFIRKKLREDLNRYHSDIMLTVDESIEINKRYMELQKEYNVLLEHKNEAINKRESEIESQREMLAELNQVIDAKTREYNTLNEEYITLRSNHESYKNAIDITLKTYENIDTSLSVEMEQKIIEQLLSNQQALGEFITLCNFNEMIEKGLTHVGMKLTVPGISDASVGVLGNKLDLITRIKSYIPTLRGRHIRKVLKNMGYIGDFNAYQ